jgi:hypothetical protein
MTEDEWLAATHAYGLIYHKSCRSDRKRRLLACAWARRVLDLLPPAPFGTAVEVSERYADGQADRAELLAERKEVGKFRRSPASDGFREWNHHAAGAVSAVLLDQFMSYKMAIEAAAAARGAQARPQFKEGHARETVAQLALTRDVFLNPFRPRPAVEPAWLAWDGGTVGRLAHAAYDERQLPSGHLDPARLAVLADALEDAGCGDAALLGHLRDPGPHVRGCWAVDLVLSRS